MLWLLTAPAAAPGTSALSAASNEAGSGCSLVWMGNWTLGHQAEVAVTSGTPC